MLWAMGYGVGCLLRLMRGEGATQKIRNGGEWGVVCVRWDEKAEQIKARPKGVVEGRHGARIMIHTSTLAFLSASLPSSLVQASPRSARDACDGIFLLHPRLLLDSLSSHPYWHPHPRQMSPSPVHIAAMVMQPGRATDVYVLDGSHTLTKARI